MAKQIAGVYEKVLECAKIEFLEKGFKEASLRTIAQNADTSTGSIYTRFTDKQGLFKALVLPVVEDSKKWFLGELTSFEALPVDVQKNDIFTYPENKTEDFVEVIYKHFDEFKLLIACSEGTIFANFIHDMVELEVKYTTRYIETTGNDAFTSGRASPTLLHMLSSAFCSGMFEVVIHNMSKEEAYVYVRQMRQFFMTGWNMIFNY